MTTMPTPSVEYGLLSPILIVFGVAVAGVLVEALLPRRIRYGAQVLLALGGLIAAFVAVVIVGRQILPPGRSAVLQALPIDGPALLLQGAILLVSVLAVVFFAERYQGDSPVAGPGAATATAHVPVGLDSFTPQASAVPGSVAEQHAARAGASQTEVFPLTMLAIGGMLVFPAANDLLTMFIALETLSLPLYLLCGLARRRRLLSQEAAMKYFLLGAFSSAFFLFGIALVYGFAGSVRLSAIATAVSTNTANETLLLAGMALIGLGLLFKIGAVPFQGWKPDVYQGAPTPITALMASCTLVSAFGALLRVFYVAFGGLTWDWRPVMWGIAIATMVVGAVLGVTPTDGERLLDYSSITHAGYILVGVIAATTLGLSSSLFYLVTYGFSTVGAFALITLVRDPGGEASHLSRWAGLGRKSPLVAGTLALFLIAFAGIPLTSGFIGKFAVFQAAEAGGATPLVIIGVLSSAVAAFFYVRIIVLMFFSDPVPDGPAVVVPSVLTGTAVAIA